MTGRILFVFFIAVIFSGCFGSQQISSENLSSIYHQSEHLFHPEFSVFHFTDDSSHLFVRLNTDEFLKTREPDNSYQASFRIRCILVESYESNVRLDSAGADFKVEQADVKSRIRLYTVDFKVPKKGNFLLSCTIIDLKKKVSEEYFINIDHDSRQSRQNFLVSSSVSGLPIMRNYISASDSFRVSYRDASVKKLMVRYYRRNFPLAYPPFSFDIHDDFNFKPDSEFTLQTDDAIPLNFIEEGIYHFQTDTGNYEGLSLYRFKEGFPAVTTPDRMIETIRYLTSRKEFEEIGSSDSRKGAVDKFWLDIGGNQDRTRILIKKYYSRIQEANRHFTSFTEGWRTDRGMIYIVFGPPNFVYKNSVSENWVYGQPNNALSLNFFFTRVNNPFTDNDFTLSRAPIYESNWYRAVDLWRQGRVYNDY
jgi:GWxTD domain-containing protein